MHFPSITVSVFLSSFASVGLAQSFTEVLQSNKELSGFLTFVQRHPAVLDIFQNRAKDVTLFVPNNNALLSFGRLDDFTTTEQQAIVRYHILNGTYESKDLSKKGGTTVPTYLEADEFALLGGGSNVVFASAYGDSGLAANSPATEVFTGLGAKSSILTSDLKFTGGVIHVVDT